MNDAVEPIKNKKNKRMVQLRYVLAPIAIILSAIVVLIAVAILAPKPAKKPVIIKAPLVEVMEIERADIEFNVPSQGTVSPRTTTVLISEVSGMIEHVSEKFQVGGFFKKGEELLSIDDITYRVKVLQAESRLGSAQATFIEEKARKEQAEDEWLLTGKSVAEAPILALRIPQLKKAEADVIAAKADLQEAQTKLSRTKIVAPYDAMLKEKKVDIGQYVGVGSELAITFAIDYAEVRLPIKQKDVAFLTLPKINQDEESSSSVDIFYQLAGEKHTWTSRLTRYEGVVDSASRVHYVIAQIDDPYSVISSSPHNEIRIGTFVNANISGKKIDDIVAIPRRALYGADTLYLADNSNELSIKKIHIMRTDEAFVYTHDQFDADKRLIITKLETPVAGMKLRISGDPEQEDEPEKVSEEKDIIAKQDES